jgi:hypothetical protein
MTNPTRRIRATAKRQEVEEAYEWSRSQVLAGSVDEHLNYDASSPWHNSHFRHRESGAAWLIYLPDQAWPGEVRLL